MQSSLLLHCRASFTEAVQPPAHLFWFFYSAIFPKYSKSIIHSRFIPGLCISYIWEVLWDTGAEPWHSTCSLHWVQGSSCLLPHTLLLSGPSAMFGPSTVHSPLVWYMVSSRSHQTQHKWTWSRRGTAVLSPCWGYLRWWHFPLLGPTT